MPTLSCSLSSEKLDWLKGGSVLQKVPGSLKFDKCYKMTTSKNMSAERLKPKDYLFDDTKTYSADDFIFRLEVLKVLNSSPVFHEDAGRLIDWAEELEANARIKFCEDDEGSLNVASFVPSPQEELAT